MDGLVNLENVLVVGMTNRKELLDEALLRPGRMEVTTARCLLDWVVFSLFPRKISPFRLGFFSTTTPHPYLRSHRPKKKTLTAFPQVCMPIPLPDASGREQILAIHLRRAREAGLVSGDVDDASLAARTGGFSGADLAGLVRSGTSFALADWRRKRGDTGDGYADAGGGETPGSSGGFAGDKADTGVSGSGGGGGDGSGNGGGGGEGPAVEITAENLEMALREVSASGGGGRGRARFRGLGGVTDAVRGSLSRVLSTPRGGGG